MNSRRNLFYVYEVKIEWSDEPLKYTWGPSFYFYGSDPKRVRKQVFKNVSQIRESFDKIGYKERNVLKKKLF